MSGTEKTAPASDKAGAAAGALRRFPRLRVDGYCANRRSGKWRCIPHASMSASLPCLAASFLEFRASAYWAAVSAKILPHSDSDRLRRRMPRLFVGSAAPNALRAEPTRVRALQSMLSASFSRAASSRQSVLDRRQCFFNRS